MIFMIQIVFYIIIYVIFYNTPKSNVVIKNRKSFTSNPSFASNKFRVQDTPLRYITRILLKTISLKNRIIHYNYIR